MVVYEFSRCSVDPAYLWMFITIGYILLLAVLTARGVKKLILHSRLVVKGGCASWRGRVRLRICANTKVKFQPSKTKGTEHNLSQWSPNHDSQ
jgi:hypothetical protein